MPRANTKSELLAETEREYSALETLIAGVSPEEMQHPGTAGDWSIKDILAHLYEWQRMFFTWYEAGLRGEKAEMPAPGYKWSQLPALNHAIYLSYRDLPLEEVLALFRESHKRTLALIHSLNTEDLETPGRYVWSGEHRLLSFISSICGSHYRWAVTGIRKRLRKKGSWQIKGL